MAPIDPTEIDGSYGEGGGAILRQALALSAYTRRAVRITRVRAKREPSGLMPQHLKAVEAVAALSEAQVSGAVLGSTDLVFIPGSVCPGTYRFDVGTAGAATLVLQTLLLPALRHPGDYRFEVIGGTDVRWSPPADYLAAVTLPVLARFGDARLTILRRGYYPRGGGRLALEVRGSSAPPPRLVRLDQGSIRAIRGISHAARVLGERRVAERQAEAAAAALAPLAAPVEIEVQYGDSYSVGSGVTLWTDASDGGVLGGSALGARGKRAEDVGREAAEELRREIAAGAVVDRHLADQLIPFLSVAGGDILTSEVTGHTSSNIYVAMRIVGTTFSVSGTRISAEAGR